MKENHMKNIDQITSEKTSRNVLNPIYRKIVSSYPKGTFILDWGCGKFHKNEEFCKENNMDWHGLDPYCRSGQENIETFQYLLNKIPDVLVCCNVLNVITDNNMKSIVSNLYMAAGYNTDIYISIFERNKNGIHEVTRDGFQRNEKTKDYLKWLNKDFLIESVHGNVIKCRKL